MIRRQGNGTLQGDHRLVIAYTSGQHYTEVVPGDRQIRLQFATTPQRGNRGIVVTDATQQGSHGVVVNRVLRALRQCLSHGVESLLGPTAQAVDASLHS